jgi:hypothetical protein
LHARREQEAKILADLTDWQLVEIRRTMHLREIPVDPESDGNEASQWERLWPNC